MFLFMVWVWGDAKQHIYVGICLIWLVSKVTKIILFRGSAFDHICSCSFHAIIINAEYYLCYRDHRLISAVFAFVCPSRITHLYIADSMDQEHNILAAVLTLCPIFNILFTLYASTCQAEFVLTNISKGAESNCLLIKSADMAAVISRRYGCQWNIFACCCWGGTVWKNVLSKFGWSKMRCGTKIGRELSVTFMDVWCNLWNTAVCWNKRVGGCQSNPWKNCFKMHWGNFGKIAAYQLLFKNSANKCNATFFTSGTICIFDKYIAR